MRQELRLWLHKFHQEMPVTTLFVTHDQHEALEIANEVVIFEQGKIAQSGLPRDLIDHPSTEFVKRFISI